jgi:hypothetical protein
MMPLQRPQNGVDGRCERHGDPFVALALLPDLAGKPIDFGPSQHQAFREPQPGGFGKGKERRVVLARGGLDPLGLITDEFTYTLRRFLEPMIFPSRFMIEADAPHLGAGKEFLQRECRGVDGARRQQFALAIPMTTTPSD